MSRFSIIYSISKACPNSRLKPYNAVALSWTAPVCIRHTITNSASGDRSTDGCDAKTDKSSIPMANQTPHRGS